MTSFDDWLAAEAEAREDAGLTRRLVDSDQPGPWGEPLLDLAGNDYLGLARDPRVIEGAVRAAQEYGAGAGASRLVSGTLSIHTELERRLARFTGFESALVLSTGYHANLSVVAALADADTLLVSDAHIHASMIDACRLSRAPRVVVPHSSVDAVRSALAGRSEPRAMVLVESIYSVLGDAAPLAELVDMCSTYDALLVVDEAHGLGVAGAGGRGLAYDLPHDNVVVTATLSKAIGTQGGAVLCSPEIREHLVNRARPFIYDTGLAPAAAGAALAALDVVESSPERIQRLHVNGAALAEACEVATPEGAVLSVPMPGPREAVAAVEAAAASGVRIGCFRPPSTPDGTSRLRLTAHAHHTDDELRLAAKVLREIT